MAGCDVAMIQVVARAVGLSTLSVTYEGESSHQSRPPFTIRILTST